MNEELAKSVLHMATDTTKLLAWSPTAENKQVSPPGSVCTCQAAPSVPRQAGTTQTALQCHRHHQWLTPWCLLHPKRTISILHQHNTGTQTAAGRAA